MIDQNTLVLAVECVTAFGTIAALIISLADRHKIVGGGTGTDVEIALLPPLARKRFESMQTEITDLKTRLREAETRLRQSGES